MHRELYPHKMPSRARARRDKNRPKKIAELNENSTERDISMEAHERKKQRDKKRYANDRKRS